MKFDTVAKYDVLIIGSGISGLMCALKLAEQNREVCLLTKEAITESSSKYAQGGIAVPLNKLDSIEQHLKDTLQAGAGLCNYKVAKEIIDNSVASFEKLISYGVKFDLTNENVVHQTLEAAHSASRVCHAGGDSTGRVITKVLVDRVCRKPNVSVSQGTIALGIIKNTDNEAFGVLVEDVTRNKYVLSAKNIILATGGIGQLYKDTTNPLVCTGDGAVIAYRLGAKLQDIEMIQFHPTVLLEKGEPLLITEAIRGEGGRLKNINGEYFASKYNKMAELATRDVLARAICYEMRRTGASVYLDLQSFKEDYFKSRFPTIYQECIDRRIDLFGVGIPVAPAAHYFIGGVKCDVYGRTSIPGLWVVGELASSGFHGANRLASNSLLECIVAPGLLVNKLLEEKNVECLESNFFEIEVDESSYKEDEIKKIISDLRFKNTQGLGLIRAEFPLNEHLKWLEQISSKFNPDLLSINYQAQELKNMLLLSNLICLAALERKHSLGVHFREDYQLMSNEFKHSIFSANKQLSWEKEIKEKQLVSFLE